MHCTVNIKKILIRIVLVSLYAILVMQVVAFAMPNSMVFKLETPRLLFLILYLFFFNLNVEGCLFFDRYLNHKLPWFYHARKRFLIQIPFIFIWTLLTLGFPFILYYSYNDAAIIYPAKPVFVFIGSIVFLLGFIGASMGINFFKQWKKSLLDVEYYKQEKLKAEYRVLQNQVNPHFLFNSFNVLISEIKHNPKIAEAFARKLSKVYRYVLQSKNYDLISLEDELKCIDDFIFLHKVRIENALDYNVAVSESVLHKKLPPLTLQIVMENAIKHNVADTEQVLHILIESINDRSIVVRNNLQMITNTNSTHTGLSNLRKRFELLEKDGFSYGVEGEDFVVKIPLIED